MKNKRPIVLLMSAAALVVGLMCALLYKASDIIGVYKAQVEGSLSDALGAQVRLGDLALSFFPRLTVAVSKLEIKDERGQRTELSIGGLEADAALWPLLSRRLEISAVRIIRPVITLQKTPEGIAVTGIKPRSQRTQVPASATSSPSSPASIPDNGLVLSINRIIVRDGEFTIKDTVGRASHQLQRIALDMGIKVSGAQLDVPHAKVALVANREIPIQVVISNASFNTSSKVAKLPQCTVTLPFGALSLQLDHDQERAVTTIQTVTLQGFGGRISAPSTITHSVPIKAASRIEATNVSIAQLAQLAAPHLARTLEGTIARAQLQLTEVAVNDPKNTASGSGSFVISNGLLKGINIPSQVLTKIDALPFMSGNLRERVPAEFEPLLRNPDTVIRNLTSDFSFSKGEISISALNLTSDHFALRGDGTYSLTGEAKINSDLILSSAVSSGVTARVRELQPLVDSQGRLVLPVTIRGTIPTVLVTPNLDEILRKASFAGVAQALDKVLKDKKVGGKLGKILGF